MLVVLFQKLDAGPFRRIGLGNFVGSHKKLCEAAAELAAANSPETRVIQYKLRLTFKDEDGDACLLLNDADVRMAFGEAANKPLKIVAEILELSSVQQQGAAAKKQPPVADASPSPAGVARSPPDTEVPLVQTRTEPKAQVPGENRHPGLHQAVESIVGVLANAVIGLQQATTEPLVADNQDAATPVAATTQDRSVPMGTTETNGSGNNDDDEEEEKTEQDERKFIHGRHTCDSCLTTPIVGKRFHAVNMADYDLCANCFGNYTGEDIQFEQVELGEYRKSCCGEGGKSIDLTHLNICLFLYARPRSPHARTLASPLRQVGNGRSPPCAQAWRTPIVWSSWTLRTPWSSWWICRSSSVCAAASCASPRPVDASRVCAAAR